MRDLAEAVLDALGDPPLIVERRAQRRAESFTSSASVRCGSSLIDEFQHFADEEASRRRSA